MNVIPALFLCKAQECAKAHSMFMKSFLQVIRYK